MINVLNLLRFIFALFIFTHHMNINDNVYIQALGPCGVSFFLILSGFVMSMGYMEKCKASDFDFKEFVVKRFSRLYPLHILCLSGALVINILTGGGRIYSIICNLFLIQSWFPVMEIYFSGNALSWCLCDLMFFYLVFPFVVRKLLNVKFAVCLLVFYVMGLFLMPENYVHAFIYINPLFRFVDFYIGIIMYKLYKKLEKKIFHIEYYLSISILVLICSILLYAEIPNRFRYQSLFWLSSCLVIISFCLFERKSKLNFDRKVIKISGDISFTFYMIHGLGISVLGSIFNRIGLQDFYLVKYILDLLIITSGAYIVNRFYETPIKNFINRKMIK